MQTFQQLKIDIELNKTRDIGSLKLVTNDIEQLLSLDISKFLYNICLSPNVHAREKLFLKFTSFIFMLIGWFLLYVVSSKL